MDILAALNDANPERGANRCKLQATLDNIPNDTPNRAALVDAVAADPKDFAAQKLTLTFSALKIPISSDLISDHRAKRCRCYR